MTTAGSAKDPAVVDVLVAYDLRAAIWADWKGGGITNFAVDAVARMNQALTNSLISSSLRFRLCAIIRINAVAPTDSSGSVEFGKVLDNVTDATDNWAIVSKARDAWGADVAVTLVDTGSAYGTTGLSWALCAESYYSFGAYAYSICSIRAVAESHVMTHEVGHLLGAGHSDCQSSSLDPGPLLRSYSSGYYFTGTDGVAYHTIMAYDDDGYGNQYVEAPFFSTPNVSYKGVRVGTDSNDNARTLRETAAHVASFRTPPTQQFDYVLVFEDKAEEISPQYCTVGKVFTLPRPGISVCQDACFAGWQLTGSRKDVFYDAGILAFNLAGRGETLFFRAVWK